MTPTGLVGLCAVDAEPDLGAPIGALVSLWTTFTDTACAGSITVAKPKPDVARREVASVPRAQSSDPLWSRARVAR